MATHIFQLHVLELLLAVRFLLVTICYVYSYLVVFHLEKTPSKILASPCAVENFLKRTPQCFGGLFRFYTFAAVLLSRRS